MTDANQARGKRTGKKKLRYAVRITKRPSTFRGNNGYEIILFQVLFDVYSSLFILGFCLLSPLLIRQYPVHFLGIPDALELYSSLVKPILRNDQDWHLVQLRRCRCLDISMLGGEQSKPVMDAACSLQGRICQLRFLYRKCSCIQASIGNIPRHLVHASTIEIYPACSYFCDGSYSISA